MLVIFAVIGIVWALAGMRVAQASMPAIHARLENRYFQALVAGRRVSDRMRAWNVGVSYVLAAVLYPPLIVLAVLVATCTGRGSKAIGKVRELYQVSQDKKNGWDDL